MNEEKLVISFHTTASAMAMERLCKKHGIDGRLAPVPRSITSDCGIAWWTSPALRQKIEDALAQTDIEVSGIHLITP